MSDLPAPARELVLFAGSLPATPFRELVAAAAGTGWDGISVWPLTYQRALSREGLDPTAMRAIVDDAGIRVTELDAVFDWTPLPDGATPNPKEWDRHRFFEAAEVLGADTVVAAGRLGATTLDLDAAAESFAGLCDAAAEHGLRISVEFVAFSATPDAATAWQVIEAAGRDNAGLTVDICHHVRSGGDDAALGRLPADRIFTVQLADGPAQAPPDLLDEAQWHRLQPGDGEFDIAGFVSRLAADGVRARVGPELYLAGWSERDPALVAADLMASTRRALG